MNIKVFQLKSGLWRCRMPLGTLTKCPMCKRDVKRLSCFALNGEAFQKWVDARRVYAFFHNAACSEKCWRDHRPKPSPLDEPLPPGKYTVDVHGTILTGPYAGRKVAL